MIHNTIKALLRPAARRFFGRIAKDIETDPETAAKFQAIADAKKSWEKWIEVAEKEYPHLSTTLAILFVEKTYRLV